MESLLDIGAYNLRDLVEYKKCGIIKMERPGIIAKRVLGRWCHRFLIVFKRSKSNCSWCLSCYEDQSSKRAEAVYILSECLSVEGYIDVRNPEIMGFYVRFRDLNRKNLVFSCPSFESKEVWMNALQSGITESQNFSAESGYASGGSVQDPLIDPLTDQYISESLIRQSRYYSHVDDINAAMADVKALESKVEKERNKETSHKKTSVVENKAHGNDPFYMNMTQSHRMNEVNMASSGVGEDSQITLGSSTGFLSVGFGSVSLEPRVCTGTQETIHPEEEGNTCPKTIYESSDESSSDSTKDNENLEKKFLQCEYLQDSEEEAISSKWIAEQPVGTFTVRRGTSTTNKGFFIISLSALQVLCVNTEEGLRKYKISEKQGKVYLSEDTPFHTLDDLVNFYHVHALPSRHTHQKLTRGYKAKK